MERLSRKGLFVLIDTVIINFAILLAFFLRFESLTSDIIIGFFLRFGILFTAVRLATFYFFGLYNRVWQYASVGELVSSIRAVTMGSVINVSLAFFVFQANAFLPRRVIVLDWILNIFLIGGSRLAWRMLRDGYRDRHRYSHGGRPILIIGAGDGGVLVARDLQNHYNGEINIVGFIDDNPAKQKMKLLGLPVLGGRENIPTFVQRYAIQEVVIAMPSVNGKVVREIVDICQKSNVKVKILPGVFDLIEGNVTVNQIREVEVEDLLGREPVSVDLESMAGYLQGQVVMVTGAGGSIGSELCRQIVTFNPSALLLLDMCENNVYEIEMELKDKTDIPLIPLVKDVRDREAIQKVFKEHKPQVIFHAAAHKHVPLMEANPEEAIKNNTMGTYNVAQAANMYSASRFVLISTDKAVNPTSIMGASKRVAEMIIQHLDVLSNTRYTAVRFGNVLGSRGSVVPLFKRQIAQGGPVTVTDENMIRYFMTIPEAVQLVIQAGALAQGGEVFVLDMGEPVKILDLATTLIKLSGFEPGVDIDIEVTGMRPGEKLYEELLTDEEGVNATNHRRIFVAKPGQLNIERIEAVTKQFVQGNLPHGLGKTEQWLKQFLPGFAVVRHAPVNRHKVSSQKDTFFEEVAASGET